MAWPYTALTTYTANTAPAIKAFDLNSFQSGINGIVAGTYNLQGVKLTTGTPGAVVTAVNGSLIAARTAFDISVPSANTVQAGEVCKDSPPCAVARFEGTLAGINLKIGYGIHAKSRLGAGVYLITLQRVPTGPSADNVVVLVTGQGPSGGAQWSCSTLDGSNRPEVLVSLGVALDYEFTLAAWVY